MAGANASTRCFTKQVTETAKRSGACQNCQDVAARVGSLREDALSYTSTGRKLELVVRFPCQYEKCPGHWQYNMVPPPACMVCSEAEASLELKVPHWSLGDVNVLLSNLLVHCVWSLGGGGWRAGVRKSACEQEQAWAPIPNFQALNFDVLCCFAVFGTQIKVLGEV